MYKCVCVCIYTRTRTHTHTYTHTHTGTHTFIHTYIYTYIHTHIHTYIHTQYIRTYILTYIHAYICEERLIIQYPAQPMMYCACMCVYTHTHTHTHTYPPHPHPHPHIQYPAQPIRRPFSKVSIGTLYIVNVLGHRRFRTFERRRKFFFCATATFEQPLNNTLKTATFQETQQQAASKMLRNRNLSNKVNYEALEELLGTD